MGYHRDDLDRMTLRQIDAMYSVAMRRRTTEQAEMASLMRSAYHAELKSFKKMLNSLED